jgi:hypothetical protein
MIRAGFSVESPNPRPGNRGGVGVRSHRTCSRSTIGFAAIGIGLAGGLIAASGCASYRFGSQSLFPQGIRTVHVPVVRVPAIGSDSFRQDLGVRLTEAIQREIELRTPYRLEHNAALADSTLTCKLIADSKRTLTEDRNDQPRALDGVMTVQATWLDRQGVVYMQNNLLPPGEIYYTFLQTGRFVPEGGQSTQTGFQQAIEELADQIVSQMEVRW